MRQRIFNILTAISLVLCLAIVVLWLGGHWRAVEIGYNWRIDAPAQARFIEVASGGGSIGVQYGIGQGVASHQQPAPARAPGQTH